MKNLPIGIQSFEKLRERSNVYVDKTKEIYDLISAGSVYFLSRPRRFGKSLLISTMDALFRGRKELFEGLYIYDRWDWSKRHPVVRLDFAGLAFRTPDDLEQSLKVFVKSVATQHSLSLSEAPYSYQFRELIELLHASAGQKVVILVDEYDKPITDHLSDNKVMNANKIMLHDFYQVLKAADDHIRFIFLTGVSKFAGISIFSALNNLNDITLKQDYASICGYTQQELESCFTERIEAMAQHNSMSGGKLLDEIRRWYNGYSWDGSVSVYNPFSTLLLFSNQEIANYWFRTGTPTFLVEQLKKRNRVEVVLDTIKATSSTFDSYDPSAIEEIPLLFQTGYLTVKKKELVNSRPQYELGIPNEEVRESLLVHLLGAYSACPTDRIPPLVEQLQQQLRAGEAAGVEQSLRLLLAHIPSTLHIEKEAYYHSLFLLMMKLLGFDIRGELLTNVGRIDAVWRQPGLTVVCEVKYHAKKRAESLLGKAMRQIRDRRYYEAFLDGKVTLMAIAFSGKEVRCKMEHVKP